LESTSYSKLSPQIRTALDSLSLATKNVGRCIGCERAMTIIDALFWLNESEQRRIVKLPLCSECGSEKVDHSSRRTVVKKAVGHDQPDQ
jgi:hypothetical protein